MSTNPREGAVYERRGCGNEGQERADERQGFVYERHGRVHARHGLVHQRQGRVDAAGLSEETANSDIPPLSVYISQVFLIGT